MFLRVRRPIGAVRRRRRGRCGAGGFTALLAETGYTVIDHGDRPVVRWRPHPHQRRPHDLTRTLEVLRDARSQVAAIFRAGQMPLVVGGECTLTIAAVSAAVEAQ
jgi:arginase